MTQETKAIVTRDMGIVPMAAPEVVLEQAMVAAKALTRVLQGKKRPVIMNGEQYLEFEDWQTCGQFYRYTVKTGDAVPVEVDGVKGAKAHADLIDLETGQILGGAEAYCMRDEEKWNTRPKYEWQGEGPNRERVQVGVEIVPWFQLASMAQTRAGAKAFRNRLAWVVVLAGYRPTPAEELTDSTIPEKVKPEESHYWCKKHNQLWFKKGKMQAYAHPFELPGGGKEWCQMPTETSGQAAKETTPTNPAPPKAEAPPRASDAQGKATEWPADTKKDPATWNLQGRWDTYRKEAQPFADDVAICKVIKLSTGLDMPVDTEGKPIMWKPPEGFTEVHMTAMEARLRQIQSKKAVKQ